MLLAFGIWFSALSNVCFATASCIFLALNVKQHAVHPRLQFRCRLGIAIQKSKKERPESITHLFRKKTPANRIFTRFDSAFTPVRERTQEWKLPQ